MSAGSSIPPHNCDVAIVGGGPSGLALAAELKRQNVNKVVVLEREQEAGGIPRHCGHYPFGLREYHRLLKGPDYAGRNVQTAEDLDVEIFTETSVTAIHPGARLSLSSSAGVSELIAQRIVLCTGVRESSRSQRFIGGERPSGVLSTGALQSLVYLHKMRPFIRPVILGSELVSFSAIQTCRHVGMHPAAMVEEQDRIIARRFIQPFLTLRGVPLHVKASNLKIIGQKHVEALAFTDNNGHQKVIKTDGIIVSGRFRPESALLYDSHLEIDTGTGGPVVNQYGQCSDPAYYSCGNLLRPAETAGWCWQEGIDTAQRIADDLSAAKSETEPSIHIKADDGRIKFVVPQRLSLCKRPNAMVSLQIGLQESVNGHLLASSDSHLIWRKRLRSRPVRRILMPLADIIKYQSGADVRLSIQGDG